MDFDLHRASAHGDSNLVQNILDTGRVHVDSQDEDGTTSLMLATTNNRLNCVRVLLKEGAEPNLRRNDGTCAIFLASRCGNSTILAFLLSDFKASQTPLAARNDCTTPLIIAAVMNHAQCIDLLLSAQLPPDEPSLTGATALFHASLRGHQESVRQLLCYKSNVARLKNGETCLHAASLSGSLAVVSLLLSAGSQPNLTNSNGQTALDLLTMFINDGYIPLTPGHLAISKLLHSRTKTPRHLPIPTELKEKLVQLYHTELLVKLNVGPSTPATHRKCPASPALRSKLTNGGSPKMQHVRFAVVQQPKPRPYSSSILDSPGGGQIQRAHCRLVTTEELNKELRRSPVRVNIDKNLDKKKSAPSPPPIRRKLFTTV